MSEAVFHLLLSGKLRFQRTEFWSSDVVSINFKSLILLQSPGLDGSAFQLEN